MSQRKNWNENNKVNSTENGYCNPAAIGECSKLRSKKHKRRDRSRSRSEKKKERRSRKKKDRKEKKRRSKSKSKKRNESDDQYEEGKPGHLIEPITPASNEMVAPPPVFEEQVVSSEPSESQFTVSSTNSNKRPIDAYDPLVDDVFMGAVQLDKIHQGLGLNEFKLFFRLPDSAKEITSTLDLFLGYRANGGEVYAFPVLCENEDNSRYWLLEFEALKRHGFESLSTMMIHYNIYSYMHPGDNMIETFPVWKENMKKYRVNSGLT